MDSSELPLLAKQTENLFVKPREDGSYSLLLFIKDDKKSPWRKDTKDAPRLSDGVIKELKEHDLSFERLRDLGSNDDAIRTKVFEFIQPAAERLLQKLNLSLHDLPDFGEGWIFTRRKEDTKPQHMPGGTSTIATVTETLPAIAATEKDSRAYTHATWLHHFERGAFVASLGGHLLNETLTASFEPGEEEAMERMQRWLQYGLKYHHPQDFRWEASSTPGKPHKLHIISTHAVHKLLGLDYIASHVDNRAEIELRSIVNRGEWDVERHGRIANVSGVFGERQDAIQAGFYLVSKGYMVKSDLEAACKATNGPYRLTVIRNKSQLFEREFNNIIEHGDPSLDTREAFKDLWKRQARQKTGMEVRP